MYAAPRIPSGVIERTDRATLRQDALQIERLIHLCDNAQRRILNAAEAVQTVMRLTGVVSMDAKERLALGVAQDPLADADNLLAEALTQVQAARTALDEQISPAMEEVL